MQHPLIQCNNVSLEIAEKPLLKNVTFSLQQKENLVIFGPNGAGKTLLLRILSGNLEPTRGTIEMLGEKLYTKDAYIIKKRIGFVSPQLFGDFDFDSKVTDIVMSGLFGSIGVASDPVRNNQKVVRDYINRVIKEKYDGDAIALKLLEQLHVVHLQEKTFGHLSYGEKVRVLIARALINDPEIFILDEPTTGLDLQMRAQFYKVVEELAGKAHIIYVTHHLEEVLPQFKKILMIKNGEIFAFGEKQDLLTSENLSALLDVVIHVHEKDGRYLAWF